jgi:uncharacterized membrane protein YtjA (UPF0391 family)
VRTRAVTRWSAFVFQVIAPVAAIFGMRTVRRETTIAMILFVILVVVFVVWIDQTPPLERDGWKHGRGHEGKVAKVCRG